MVCNILFLLLLGHLSSGGLAEIRHTGGYSYSWKVFDEASGNDYGHRESKTSPNVADQVTEGEYYVKLPDGRLQTVIYSVNPESGFRARVIYDKEVNGQPASNRNSKAFSSPSAVPNRNRPLLPIRRPTEQAKLRPVQAESNVLPAYYKPLSYEPAKVNLNDAQIRNLQVPEWERAPSVVINKAPLVKPLAPPENESHDHEKKPHDPYYKTESELQGYDFSKPFFYPYTKKISKEGRFKGDHHEKKHDHVFRRY